MTGQPTQLILADPEDAAKVLSRLSGLPFSWVFLGQGIEDFHQVKTTFEGQGDYLDTNSQFQSSAEELRGPYLNHQYHIGRELDSIRWWVTNVSYRTCYVSKSFHRTCYLKVGLDLAQSWERPGALVVVADAEVRYALKRNLERDGHMKATNVTPARPRPFRPLFDIINMLAHRIVMVVRESYRIAQARRMIRHPYVPDEPTILLMSTVSFRSIHLGADFHRWFFGDLANQLVELGYRVALVPRILDLLSYKRALAGLTESSLPYMVPNRYLGFRELVSTAIATCKPPTLPRPLPHLAGMDIENFINSELRTHWISNAAVHSLLMTAVIRRWAELGSSINRMIHVYENQPWERAICWETKRCFPEATVVGYQHANVEQLLLNFHLAPGEVEVAPLPDRIVTVGRYTAKILSGGGYKPGQVRAGGALQMQELFAGRSTSDHKSASRNQATVLVAPSNGIEEAAELVDIAGRLFDESEGVKVILKCHPAMPLDMITKSAGVGLPPNVILSEEWITDLMQKCDLMVYSGSSVCFQALTLGLPVIHFSTRFDLDLDPLEAAPEARLNAIGVDDLREKVRWLLAHREEYIAENQEMWDLLVDEIYSPVNEHSYRAFVD